MFIILLRRLSVRGRLIVGLLLVSAGAALIATPVVAVPGLLIHGVIVAVIGAILLGSALASRHRSRVVVQPHAGEDRKLSAQLTHRGDD